MPRKQKTREEILEKAKLARRRRYEKIKSDLALYALQKEKEHQRYLKRKEQNFFLSINDITPRGKRQKWRENFNKFYKRKIFLKRGIEMINDNTLSCSDNEDPLRVDEKQINSEVGHNPPHNQVNTKMVGKLQDEAQNVHNKENEHSNSSPLIKLPNAIIHSNILLNPICKSNTEVTRLCDIILDNKLNLYPKVDIYAMVKKYNICNATSNFSGYFEDPNLINCSLLSICQNVPQGPEPNTLKDFRSFQNSLMEASGSSFRNQVALPISHSIKVSHKRSRKRILDSSDDSIEIKDHNDGFVTTKTSTNDTDSDRDLEIFPKRKYFN